MPLSESEYLELAQPELGRLLDALDTLGDEVDAELSNDILSIELPSGPRFVLNSHRAARQIWMAADSHAWHFDLVPGRGWVAQKSDEELWDTLQRALTQRLGRPVALPRS
jgi:CyaY protein